MDCIESEDSDRMDSVATDSGSCPSTLCGALSPRARCSCCVTACKLADEISEKRDSCSSDDMNS